MNVADIPKYISNRSMYHINCGWNYLETWLSRNEEDYGQELNPDFQRGHVWNEQQQIKFVEHVLKGGNSGRDIYFNCPGWNRGAIVGPIQCVDGLQRLTAALRFLRNEIPAFGCLLKDFLPSPRVLLRDIINFEVYVNDFDNKADVLRWYIEMNTGGTVHSDEEIERVKGLLKQEEGT